MASRLLKFALVLAAVLVAGAAHGQPTAFTYQGRLTESGATVTGSYDLRFSLYDVASDGSPLATVELPGTAVSNGLFTVELDFGAAVLSGADRWLQIEIGTGVPGAYTPLSPRQALRSAPYAVRSLSAADADSLGGVPASSYLQSGDLTNIDASNITSGTLANARLSSNVPQLDAANVFTAGNTFAGLSAGGAITNVATPTAATDAANKSYVDSAVAGATAGGSAGGDLAGTYPNPTIASTAGASVVSAINASSATLSAARLPTTIAYLDGTNTFTGTNTFNTGLSANSQRITSVANPTASTDAANKAYVDSEVADVTASGSAGGDLTGTYPNPTIASTAGANVVTAINASSSTLSASRLPTTIAYQSGTNTFTGTNTFNAGLSANDQRITNVATPTASDDAANKDYVDGLVSSEMWVAVDDSHTWTNLGSSSTFGDEYSVVNVANFTEIKLLCHVATAGSSGSTLRVNFQQTGGGWATLVSGCDLGAAGTQETSYTTLAAGPIDKGLLRIVAIASGGDGSADPETQGVAIMLKR